MNYAVNKENIYKRSLELARQYIAETSPNVLEEEILKYEGLGIAGPTFDEYLVNLQEEVEGFLYSRINEEIIALDISKIQYQINSPIVYYSPPPSDRISKKKDSAIMTESFFLL